LIGKVNQDLFRTKISRTLQGYMGYEWVMKYASYLIGSHKLNMGVYNLTDAYNFIYAGAIEEYTTELLDNIAKGGFDLKPFENVPECKDSYKVWIRKEIATYFGQATSKKMGKLEAYNLLIKVYDRAVNEIRYGINKDMGSGEIVTAYDLRARIHLRLDRLYTNAMRGLKPLQKVPELTDIIDYDAARYV